MQKAILEEAILWVKKDTLPDRSTFYGNKRTRYHTGIRENTIKFYMYKHSDEIFDNVTTAITQEMQTY